MTDYSGQITITVPINQRETGKRISRALDADAGGYEAFAQFLDADMQPCDESTAVYTTYSSPCSQELAGSMSLLIANPAILQGKVADDYAARWADLVPPSLGEIEVFCAGVVLPQDTPQIEGALPILTITP
jgi:hypothetical protein